jgi:uncharacterized membrane protein YphA (DoxX/SURF4 family)
MKHIVSLFRFIIGAVFLFSGFVKAVDPYGTAYKMEEYINVFGLSGLLETMPWLPIVASVVMCSLEFIIGFMMFFHIYKKCADWLSGLIMLFFTVLTLTDALTNKVSDCGCFGDAIKLTNWQTFWKNVVLDALLIVIYVFEKNRKGKINLVYKRCLLAIGILFVGGFSIYNVIYEPIIDFRQWKVGNQIILPKAEQKPPVSFAEYKNNETGKVQEFDMTELMNEYQKDPSFKDHWTFVNSRVINPNEVKADGFSMIGLESNDDKTFEYLSNDEEVYLIPVVDLFAPSDKAVEKTLTFAQKQIEKGRNVAIITATSNSKWIDFIDKFKINNIDIYSTDDKAIKTIARSKIAIVELKDGKVLNKWSWRKLPKE